MSRKRAFVTGVSGQDGSYLSQFLFDRGYDVYGLQRRTSVTNPLPVTVTPVNGDMTDPSSLSKAVREIRPHEVYNLAAQSHVGESFLAPQATAQINALGAHALFEAVRTEWPTARVYQASTSEQFGGDSNEPYSEASPFNPKSPYACAKVYAHNVAKMYREAYGSQISCGILFNHESPRRGAEFVTRKITRAIGRIVAGTQTTLELGNLDAVRDWGFAGDYVEAMWLMLQHSPDDFVIATGQSTTVRNFLGLAFRAAGLSVDDHVKTTPGLRRPNEVNVLRADPSKALRVLGWAPKSTFLELIVSMVNHDIYLAQKEARK